MICCGQEMKQHGGALRCQACGAQSSGNPNVIRPDGVYIQPGTTAPPLAHELAGPLGTSRNREEN
jgi:hypothetical protein